MTCHSIVAINNLLARNLIAAGPAVLLYTVVVPAAARLADRHFRLTWPLPSWTCWVGAAIIPLGALLAFWPVWLLAATGRGTPNPLAPPVKMVAQGPCRYSRNPMMLGGWIAGLGLAMVLGSPSLLAACALVAVAGSLYVPLIEEPRRLERFGPACRAYMRVVPRWVRVCHGLPHHAQNG
jgi:protein-S-isoprenylcysteine O-methyltransferase Ste14